MRRILVTVAALLLASTVWAGQPGSSATPTLASAQIVSLAPPAADKVYPPLPTLAMLPPSADEDDDPPPRVSAKKKKTRHGEPRVSMPVARLVVSDQSRVYLKDVERQIDLASAR
jgi:hypothetical protein